MSEGQVDIWDIELPSLDKLVLIAIASECDESGAAKIPLGRLATRCGLHRVTTSRIVGRLEQGGYVHVERPHRKQLIFKLGDVGSGAHPTLDAERIQLPMLVAERIQTSPGSMHSASNMESGLDAESNQHEGWMPSATKVGCTALPHSTTSTSISAVGLWDWLPHEQALTQARKVAKNLDPEEYIVRYIGRCESLNRQPSHGEFLTWFIEDDRKAAVTAKAAAASPIAASGWDVAPPAVGFSSMDWSTSEPAGSS
jgi:hypothetical protein